MARLLTVQLATKTLPSRHFALSGGLTTIDELLALEPLLGDFKAVQDGNVWCLTKDFYQESLELSDLVVDLHTVLSGADTPLRFLTKLQ